MQEFAKLLRDFLSRDLIFIVGGGEVMLASAYVFNYWDRISGPTALDFPVWIVPKDTPD